MEDRGPRVCPQCGSRYADATFCRKDGVRLRVVAERDPRIGQSLLGQFRIDEKIGEGGMGLVYRARQVTLDRDVAIKLLHVGLANSPDAVHRFQREARISTALDHPNVVRVFLSGKLPDGSLYLAMELLEGRTLADLLRVEPRLPIPRVMHILTQLCDGIGEAHDQSIVHRDVKPENVMLITRGRDTDFVKVVDFGIARLWRPEDQTQQTQQGLVLGTVRYISPEGAAGAPTDARSDVYSIGVLAYQMLCGEPPFEAPTAVGLIVKHLHEPPLPLKMRPGAAGVPDAIADVVMRSLSKNPFERAQDANELAEAFRLAARAGGVPEKRFRELTQPTIVPATEPAPPFDPDASAAAREARSSRGLSLLIGGGAFVTGVVAVLAVVAYVRASAPPTPAEQRRTLVTRAEAALIAHRWDGQDGVREITDTLLSEYPADADGLRVRHDAALLIIREGDHARDRGQTHEARRCYEDAEALDETSAAHARIAAIDHPTPPHPRGIVVTPAAVEHTEVTLTATLDADVTDGTTQFVIRQTRRHTTTTIPATATGAGTYTATYTFPLGGPYEIRFEAGAQSLTTTVEVTRSPHPTR